MAETVRENALRLLKAMSELQARNHPNATVEVRALEADRAGLVYRSETYDDAMEWLLVKGALREDPEADERQWQLPDIPPWGLAVKITEDGLEMLWRKYPDSRP